MFTNLLAAGARLHPYTSHYYGSYGHGYGAGLHGVLGWVVAIVVIYAVVHVIFAHLFHAVHRTRGRHVNYGWSLWRGPWVSWRVLGGTYYHHV